MHERIPDRSAEGVRHSATAVSPHPRTTRSRVASRVTRWVTRTALLLAAAVVFGGAKGCPQQAPATSTTPTPTPTTSQPARGTFRLAAARFIGGAGSEDGRAVLALDDGTILIGGNTTSTTLQVSPDAVQKRYAGDAPDTPATGLIGGDLYIARLLSDLTFDSATYLGGSLQERSVYGMLVDRLGDIYVASATRSQDVPGTGRTYHGGDSDVLVARLGRRLDRLIWSVLIGGDADDSARGGLAFGPDGNVYLVGSSTSSNYPVTAGTVAERALGRADGIVTKLDAQNGRILLSTRVGGNADEALFGVTVLANGDLIANGHTQSTDFAPGSRGSLFDVLFFRMSYDMKRLMWTTGVGGSGTDLTEHGLWAENSRILIPALTGSADSPLGAGTGALLLDVDPDTGSLTTVRRIFDGQGFTISPVVDSSGRIYVVGQTAVTNLQMTSDALQPTYGGGATDGFLVVLRPDGTREYATYFGGAGDDNLRAVAERDGKVFLIGNTSSRQLPFMQGAPAGDQDMLVMVLERQTP